MKENKTMTRKLYYKYEPNNGEPFIIDPSIENIKGMLESEFQEADKERTIDTPEITISFVWLTDKEFKELPDAY